MLSVRGNICFDKPGEKKQEEKENIKKKEKRMSIYN